MPLVQENKVNLSSTLLVDIFVGAILPLPLEAVSVAFLIILL